MIHFGCPEPAALGGVGLVERQPAVLPVLEVGAGVAAYAVGIVSAVSVIDAVLEQDVRVSEHHCTLLCLCLCPQAEAGKQRYDNKVNQSFHHSYFIRLEF